MWFVWLLDPKLFPINLCSPTLFVTTRKYTLQEGSALESEQGILDLLKIMHKPIIYH